MKIFTLFYEPQWRDFQLHPYADATGDYQFIISSQSNEYLGLIRISIDLKFYLAYQKTKKTGEAKKITPLQFIQNQIENPSVHQLIQQTLEKT